MMRRRTLPLDDLQAWAKLNGVRFCHTRVTKIIGADGQGKGSGLLTTDDVDAQPDGEKILLSVPGDLILSLVSVTEFAKSDVDLRDVLEAAGDFSRSARGAILIFLLLQITHSSPDLEGAKIGVTNPLTDYVAFLPESFSLPTYYSEHERDLLEGTSLEAALEQKQRSLVREFDHLRAATANISWCNKYWWGDDIGPLTLDDWRNVDAMYRSRALELPGIGHAMVPCVDMANHASGDETVAVYETDRHGHATLQLRQGKQLKRGDEITITYGDEKGACEMLFSYGFLESSVRSARQLLLDLDIPDDDPLRIAKKAVCNEAPGVRIFSQQDGSIGWESEFMWWACVNEEDGLDFSISQTTDGVKQLHALWRTRALEPSKLRQTLLRDSLRDVFELRAVVTLQSRVERQVSALERSGACFESAIRQPEVRRSTWEMIRRLRNLELEMLIKAHQSLQAQIVFLSASETVRQYLQRTSADAQKDGGEIDFS